MKKLLMWKPLNSAMIDPGELQSYIDQGWEEVGVIWCKPIRAVESEQHTSTQMDDETGSSALRGGRNDGK